MSRMLRDPLPGFVGAGLILYVHILHFPGYSACTLQGVGVPCRDVDYIDFSWVSASPKRQSPKVLFREQQCALALVPSVVLRMTLDATGGLFTAGK